MSSITIIQYNTLCLLHLYIIEKLTQLITTMYRIKHIVPSLCTRRYYSVSSIKHNLTNNNNKCNNQPQWYNTIQQWTEDIYKQSSANPVIRTSQLESDIQHRFYATFNDPTSLKQYYNSIQQYNQKQISIHPASHLCYFVNHTPTKYVIIHNLYIQLSVYVVNVTYHLTY